ncbi:hypothetical protein ACQ4PT_058613 [Festuca glaucescens]
MARLDELRIACEDDYQGQYDPPLASLSCAATLRVLELHLCMLQLPSSSTGLALPSLNDLTLERFFFSEGYLQAMVDVAPVLASLALVNIGQRAKLEPAEDLYDMPKYFSLPLRLRCPTTTDLALVQNNIRPINTTSGPYGTRTISRPSDGVSDLPDVLTSNRASFICLKKSLRKVTLQLRPRRFTSAITWRWFRPTSDGVSDLPDVLTSNRALLRCLKKSLRKVTLQFKAKEVSCFQVQFAKFLVENAMVMEEMHIDDGSQFLPGHW